MIRWFYKSEDVQIFVAPTAFSSLFVPGREPRAPSVASLRSLRKSARPKTLTTSVSAPELRRQCFGKTSSFDQFRGLWGCEVRTRVCVGVWESSSVSNDLTVETLLGFYLQLRRQGQGHRRRRCRNPMTLLHLALHLSIQKLTCWFGVHALNNPKPSHLDERPYEPTWPVRDRAAPFARRTFQRSEHLAGVQWEKCTNFKIPLCFGEIWALERIPSPLAAIICIDLIHSSTISYSFNFLLIGRITSTLSRVPDHENGSKARRSMEIR